ncbi:MAG: hypothetical protein U0Q18_07025 [Bryobacteraceae bacterium]
MKIVKALLAGVLLVSTLFGQPVISSDGVVSAASYVPTGFVHSGIARGSFFSVFGQGLGPATGQLVPSLPLPVALGGTSIRVTVGATTVDALIHFTSATQVNAVLPSRTPAGDGTLTVTYGGRTSAAAPIHVVNRSFGIFTRNMAGRGPAIVQNFVSPTQQPLNALSTSAQTGQVAILWGTGLGPISGDDSVAPTPGNLTSDVQVLVGGKSASILYAGRSPQFPGIDQINFQVPETAAGCYVPIALKVEGVIGNYGTMAINPTGGTCSDPTTMSAADLNAVASNGSAKIGLVYLSRMRAQGDLEVKVDEARAAFYQRTIDQLNASPYMYEYGTSLGTCLTYTRHVSNGEYDAIPEDTVNRIGLNAGSVMHLNGPQGAKQLTLTSPGWFDITTIGGGFGGTTLPEYLVPGHYTADNGTGGADVGSFTATLDLQPTLSWTNQDSVSSINRARDLTVRWTGGDPEKEFVVIVGLSVDATSQILGSFVCAERPAAGQFTVPASILSHLPVTTPWTGDGFPTATLTVATQPLAATAKFAAPGLDAAYFTYAAQNVALVNFN